MTNLTLPIFTDADKAREHLEAIHWPEGPICPHCGVVDEATLVQGKSHRPGMYQCNACREPFSVTVGTVMESSKIPLNKWVLGFHLMAASKKGISAHQLHRMLGITYKSAWFMAHRIREAMAPAHNTPMGGEGQVIEADELYIAKAPLERSKTKTDGKPFIAKGMKGTSNKHVVVALIERNGGGRSFHIRSGMDKATMNALIANFVRKETDLHTDESRLYGDAKQFVAKHETIRHRDGEYARGNVNTNSAEGHFGVFTRGLVGTYQHMSEQHLQRYLNEFDFRRNTRSALGIEDADRAARMMKGAVGKRLTYRKVAQ
jgi:transposase-like protein